MGSASQPVNSCNPGLGFASSPGRSYNLAWVVRRNSAFRSGSHKPRSTHNLGVSYVSTEPAARDSPPSYAQRENPQAEKASHCLYDGSRSQLDRCQTPASGIEFSWAAAAQKCLSGAVPRSGVQLAIHGAKGSRLGTRFHVRPPGVAAPGAFLLPRGTRGESAPPKRPKRTFLTARSPAP